MSEHPDSEPRVLGFLKAVILFLDPGLNHQYQKL